jgi:hypothetical protein
VTGITFQHFIEHPQLLGGQFRAPSWQPWKIVLRAAFGERLSPDEQVQFRALAERDPPPARVSELWVAAGRRAGKDSCAAAIATFIAVYGDFGDRVRLGERITVLCLAVDKSQSAIVFNYVRGFFENISLLRALLVSANNGVIELSNGVDIIVSTNSFRAIRGRTIACGIMDEVAFWRDESSANPDVEVYNSLMPAMITLRGAGAMLIAMSSVYRKQGLLYEKFSKHHGREDGDVLFVKAPSVVLNPTLAGAVEAAEIERLRREDRERAAAEWDSEWRSDIAALFDRAALEAAIDWNVRERAHDRRFRYVAATDESGGNGRDASSFTICHIERSGLITQDLIRIWRPPFKPAAVIAEKARLCAEWHIGVIYSDNWGGGLPPDLYRKRGIRCETLPVKTKLYLDLLHIVNSGRLRALDHPQTLSEAIALERRVRFGGGETIDHPVHGSAHDDAVNVLAAAVSIAAGKPGPLRISAAAKLWSKTPNPQRADPGRMDRHRQPPAGFFRQPANPGFGQGGGF